MKICNVNEMRLMDRYAIEKMGIPEEILMENAGQASAFILARELGIRGRTYAVLCGVGNNGGDGFVVARNICSHGGEAKVFIAGDVRKFKGAAKQNLQRLSGLPVEVRTVQSAKQIGTDIRHADGIIDALFGTGLDRRVEGLYEDLIRMINECGRPVLSLDIPSGVNGDTGEIMGAAVKADYTVTFGLPKIGNILYPGYGYCGKLHVCHISFPPLLYDNETIKVQTNDPVVLPERDRDAHKGSMGDVLFIAGAANYYGAPYFSAFSFLKAGGGYARLATPASIVPLIAQIGSEIVFVPQKETASGSLSLKNKTALLELAEKVDLVVIGPGLSLTDETQQLVREIVPALQKPVLIDGDGLTAIADEMKLVKRRKSPTILTPHPGEMSRITKRSANEIRKQRIEILQRAAREFNAFIALKGAHSLIGYPDDRVFVNLSGNAGMATAGAGDVLTGTIAAMHGLGLPIRDAVRQGVYLHGLAGDLAASDTGEDGLMAGDILNYLPLALKSNREGLEPYEGIPVV